MVETDRFSGDGKLVTKTVYPLAKQKLQPILDDSGRFEAGKSADLYSLLVLQAGTCNSMAE